MVVIIPKSEKEFTDLSYWKKFFKHNSSFEWYGDYSKLGQIFEKYIKSTDSILQIGCGNSSLADDLYDNGYRSILSIDTDQNVIDKQNKKNLENRPTLKFKNCSASNIDLQNSSVNVIIDKGTLDALLPSKYSEKEYILVDSIFNEIERCLAPFGRYIILSSQEHIIQKLLNYFDKNQFMIRFQKCFQSGKEFVMPVFAVIITKLKIPLPQKRKIEYLNGMDIQPELIETSEKLIERIKVEQQLSWFKHYISKGPIEEASLKIYFSNGKERYELFIIDEYNIKKLTKYGVFIVPLGRENDWIFVTTKGRQNLRMNCQLHRLIMVRLFRDQDYQSLDAIQNELNNIILDFMPKDCINQKINYLSLGSTDVSETIETGNSKINGKWTVEHVIANELTYRRLIFLDSSNLVQSEVEVNKIKNKTKDEEWKINWSNPFSCEHHKNMTLALNFLFDTEGRSILLENVLNEKLRIAVLGVGGGIILKAFHDILINSIFVGVELDEEVVEIASKHFEFPKNSERIKIVICDAINFIKESAEQVDKFDIIFVDLSGQVNPEGLYCPPSQFVTKEALTFMKKMMKNGGVLALNLVTRDEQTSIDVKKTIKSVFSSVYCDVNEIVFCSLSPKNEIDEMIKETKSRQLPPNICNWLKEYTDRIEKIVEFTI
uniref:Methyltransferase type 11 domain-containing protein n=1 Tax=Meloidogyne floridensis TaxID=298350 RepID=A0A915NTN2_9BILA